MAALGRWPWLLGLVLVATPTVARARRYPITKSDGTGTWIGTQRGVLNGRGELWQRFGAPKSLPKNFVTDLELSPRDVWVTTEAGLARLNKGSRRWESYGPPQLPSLSTTAVSLDPSDPFQVWIGTRAGLAHFDVRTNRWQIYGKGSGLPSLVVNDVFVRGRTVWAATDAGLAAYDVKNGTWRVYREKDGLAGTRVIEIDEQGPDLWLTCDQGLSRMNLQRRTFSSFRKKQGLPGTTILAQARLQTVIYLVTDKGLITYDISSDSLVPFIYRKGLNKAQVRSVTTAGGFVWFGTNKGVARFEPTKKVWQYFTMQDGLSTADVYQVSVAGAFLMVFGKQGELDSYNYAKDEWIERTQLLAKAEAPKKDTPGSQPASQPATKLPPKKLRLSVSAELDTELKQEWKYTDGKADGREGYWLVNVLRLGAGVQWASGRKVDISGNIDWGDLNGVLGGSATTLRSFQSYDFELRYLGLQDDFLQEATFNDELRLTPEGGRLAERTELEGARVVLAAGPRRSGGRFARLELLAGLRRGTPARVVFRRPSVGTLTIKRFMLFQDGGAPRKVIANSVRALLDGRELDRNVDYFVDHDNGVFWLKNTDLLHALRVLEVEFEYEQIPRKNVGAVSMTGLLPKDGDIGQLKRSGAARWARDEDGLFAEIDGGADQFINRGWVKSLSQSFEWGSAGVTLRIFDMGSDKNANSIYLARKLPDAKPVPGLEGVVIERQPASITVKLLRGQYYTEITIDQGTMEQEILAIAGWLVSKLTLSGSTKADALRDMMVSAGLRMRLTDNTQLGFRYIGALSRRDADVRNARRTGQDLFAIDAAHKRRFGSYTLDARAQVAGTSTAEEQGGRSKGGALLGQAQLSGERLLVRAQARKYTANYGGIGIARQTEFCRTEDQRCLKPGQSRLDYEVGADATWRLASFLPVSVNWQRQASTLGAAEYADAPAERDRVGLRDVAGATVGLDRAGLPKMMAGAGYIRRSSPLSLSNQWRARGSLESDLGNGLLKKLKFKKIYLRGLYEYGVNAVDEHRIDPARENDRTEKMHHGVGELRVAPTLTENAYATLEYHRLVGALDADGRIAEQLVYWRLDGGAGSSIVPGLALRFDGTLWLGDDQPRPETATTAGGVATTQLERQQQASSRLTGTMDLFPGEWIKKLSPLRLNGAYTYTLERNSQGRRSAAAPFGKEVCDAPGDEDGDGLENCDDPDCALADVCLLRTTQLRSHRAFGTVSWNTPGKLEIEVFGDMRFNHAAEDDQLRSTRYEVRSAATWRPIQSSPLTLRLDMLRESSRPEKYDGIQPLVEPMTLTLEPAFEWRRRWSVAWWHLAKIAVTRTIVRDLPHIRTFDDLFAKEGELERQDYNEWAIRPSLEVRRRFDAKDGSWNFRPYVRASYRYRVGEAVQSRLTSRTCGPDDPCLSDGSQTGHLVSMSVGFIWVHSEHVYVDLDLTGAYNDCVKAAVCRDLFTISPHLLATARF